jgi:hypothetical protein
MTSSRSWNWRRWPLTERSFGRRMWIGASSFALVAALLVGCGASTAPPPERQAHDVAILARALPTLESLKVTYFSSFTFDCSGFEYARGAFSTDPESTDSNCQWMSRLAFALDDQARADRATVADLLNTEGLDISEAWITYASDGSGRIKTASFQFEAGTNGLWSYEYAPGERLPTEPDADRVVTPIDVNWHVEWNDWN